MRPKPKNKQKELGPGPGAYESPKSNGGPRWQFSKSQKLKERLSGVPGPGEYEIKPVIGNLPSYSQLN